MTALARAVAWAIGGSVAFSPAADPAWRGGGGPALGPELVVNGGFDADTGWTKGVGWSIGSGVASSDGTQTGNSLLYRSAAITYSVEYEVNITISNYSAGLLSVQLGSQTFLSNNSGDGTYTGRATYFSGPANVYVIANADFVGSVDDVSVRQVF